ncbi:MAG: hypothetical protein QOG57_2312 [Pseudonocardiales bacterium]|jgi:hypothetical protein|nr:hypothetical protein [Pseudonocardiales bacterium]
MPNLPAPRYRRPITAALAALVGTGAVLLTAACSGGSTAPSSAAPPSAGAHHRPAGIAGKITAESGTTWTVVNAQGTQFTVDITPQTTFGTRQAQATAQQFPVGTMVRAMGQVSGSTVTATHIVDARMRQRGQVPASAPAPAPAPASGAPSPS